MAHYAILDDNNIVTAVIVGKDENEPLPEGILSWEEYYGGKRCSYNTFGNTHSLGGKSFRGNFPTVGSIYDKDFDVFYPQQPHPSWKLNYNTFIWEAPAARPEPFYSDNWIYRWSEINKEWIKVELPSAN
jgi:hypothetical protein